MSARTRTPRTALLPLPHRPSTRARRADRQISSHPQPTVRQRARVEALDLRHRRGVPADALLARAPSRRPDPARTLRPRRVALPLAHVAVRVHRTGRGVFRPVPPPRPSRRRARARHQSTRDAPSHRGGGIAGHPDPALRGRPPRSMARARRFIERVHPKLRNDGLRARTSRPRRRDPFSRLSRHATDDADVHGGRREVRGQGVHVVGGRATVLEPRRAFRRPRRRRRRRLARRGVGGDRSGLDPARVGVRVNEGDAGEGARSGRRRRGGRRGGGRAAATVLRPRPRPRGRRDAAADNRRVGDFEPAPAPPPPPGAVETLTSMGFDEHDARRALGMCGNDLEAATDALLADVR